MVIQKVFDFFGLCPRNGEVDYLEERVFNDTVLLPFPQTFLNKKNIYHLCLKIFDEVKWKGFELLVLHQFDD